MSLGSTIREARKNHGFTLNQLAKLAGVSKAYLSQLENEKFSNPTTDILKKLSGSLDISIETLLNFTGLPLTMGQLSGTPAQLRTLAREEHLDNEDINMLSRIIYRGKQPNSVEGWRDVLKAIRQSTEPK